MRKKSKPRTILKRCLEELFPRLWGVGAIRGLGKPRYEMLMHAFMYTANEKVKGDYLEFGVARGRTMIYAAQISKRLRETNQRFIGFDSFEGFPEPKGLDAIFKRFEKGDENHGGIEIAKKHIRRHGFLNDNLRLVKGWYEDVLTLSLRNESSIIKARVVNVDCDMYESTKLVLNFLTDTLQDGTIILFDDWLCFRGDPEKGQQKAVAEWLGQNPQISLFRYKDYANVGQSFIVNVATD